MDSLFQDLRYGARMLVRTPGFALVAVLSLGLGIGANAGIFSLVNATLLRPLPIDAPERLVSVFTTDRINPGNLPVSHLNFLDFRASNEVFVDLAAVAFAQANLRIEAEADQVQVQVVSGNYFEVLGARPILGRTFRPEEDVTPGSHPVAVLSHSFWERQFGADPNVAGRTIRLNRIPFTVIGVAPRGFTGTVVFGAPTMWVPMMMHDVVQPGFDWYDTRRGLFLFPFGRLKPGVTLEQARAAMTTLAGRLEREYPNDNDGRSLALVPLLEARVNPNGQGLLVLISALLMAVVGIVLLIACANIANLLLARAMRRRREVAVRLALGAARMRLVRQFLTESVLLATIGGGLGLLLAHWTVQTLAAADVPLPFPVDEVPLDARIFAFTLSLSIVTGLLFGLAPALMSSRTDVVPLLKSENVPAVAGSRRVGFRDLLVAGQIGLSLVALVVAGLLLRSMQKIQSVEPGFETDRMLVMSFNLGREGYTPERGQIFYEQAVERVGALPGIRTAAVARDKPFAGGLARSIFLEGQETSTQNRTLVQTNIVGLSYFGTMGIPIVGGRDFGRQDAAEAPPVVIINETMASRFWPGQDALGKRFRFFGEDDYTEVIGIVRDTKYNALVEDPIPYIYEPLLQDYTPDATLHARAEAAAGQFVAAIRTELRQMDPQLSVFDIETLQDQVEQSVDDQRFSAFMLAVFGALALLLAAVGTYGLASYSVGQRTREISIRIALGADPAGVLALVLRQGMALALSGIAVGLAIALGLTRLLSTLLFGVETTDPLTFATTCGLLALVAFAANYFPARRAARVDPLVALRSE